MLNKILKTIVLTLLCLSCSTNNVMQHAHVLQKMQTVEQLSSSAVNQRMESIWSSVVIKTDTSIQTRKLPLLALRPIDSTKCDLIITKNGDEIKSKVIEVSADEISYKKCENLTGPNYRIKKSEIAIINYANGTHEKFPDATQQQTTQSRPTINEPVDAQERKVEGFGVAGFIIGIIGLFFLSSGIIPIVFGAISLGKIGAHPKKFKGKGFAIASLILGLVALAYLIVHFL